MRPWITAAVGVIAALLAGGEAWREGAISWSLAAVWIAYAPFLAWITMAKLWDEVPVDDDSYDKFKSWLLALTWLLGGVSGLLHGLVAAAPASAHRHGGCVGGICFGRCGATERTTAKIAHAPKPHCRYEAGG